MTSKQPAFKLAKTYSIWPIRKKLSSGQILREALPYISVPANQVTTLHSPTTFRDTLLQLIANAKSRIIIGALYLQDDEAGQEILTALHQAKKTNPALEVICFVDWHRAQRALIGKEKSAGNSEMYKRMASEHNSGVMIYGVPVQKRELTGVMHIKGFIIDDHVLYSGASLNNVYLQKFDRYRIDRYHLIQSQHLANSITAWFKQTLLTSAAVLRLDTQDTPKTHSIKGDIISLRQAIARSFYEVEVTPESHIKSDEVGISPLLGLGTRNNMLNKAIVMLLQHAEKQIVLFTPYFNLPKILRKTINKKLKQGCQVNIVLGDKKANDFYIPPEEPFKSIGALPYLYEVNLRRFCKTHQKSIDSGLLKIHLWHHEDNTYHLKGLLIDDHFALLTGNNMNPRAWRFDLENGLVIYDPNKNLYQQNQQEFEKILEHTQQLKHYTELESVNSYPTKVQRLIKRFMRLRADRLINQLL